MSIAVVKGEQGMAVKQPVSYDIGEENLRNALNNVVGENLKSITQGLCLLYAVFAVSHQLVLQGEMAVIMTAVASITALLLLSLRLLLGLRPPSNRWAHPIGALIAALVLLNSLLHLHLKSEPRQTTNLVLLIIGVGSFFLSIRWLALIIAATIAGWISIAYSDWGADQAQAWIHFGFALFGSVVLSFLVHKGRLRTFRRIEGLRLRDEFQRAELEAALITTSESRSQAETSRLSLEEKVQSLRVSEARTRAIIDNMLEGLITTNEFGFIESINPAAERIFGYKGEELKGQHLVILMPDLYARNAEEFLKVAYSKSIGRVTEWQGRRKNAEVFPFELLLYKFETPEGKRLAGNIRDISERKEVDRLKKEFVSTVSHELRTPLTSMHGSLSLLAAGVLGELPEEALEAVSIAERNTVRLIGLINDILDLEKLESGKMEMNYRNVSLDEIFGRSIELIRGYADQNKISIRTEPVAVSVYGDGDRLVQVLINLLSNAVKFSPDGGVVEISAEESSKWVEVRIKDHGQGIHSDFKEAIFERFRQVESSDTRQKGGTGLGLAICKAIIEQHSGMIDVESEVGKGSTFWFRVPRASVID
jgi:PAS domain S-box-containing protein